MLTVPDALPCDLIEVVRSQLPEGIRDQLRLELRSDAYRLVTRAVFTSPRGQRYECALLPLDIGARIPIAGRIPDEAISFLCMMV